MMGPNNSGRTAASIMIAQPAWQFPITQGLPLAFGCAAITFSMKIASARAMSWSGGSSGWGDGLSWWRFDASGESARGLDGRYWGKIRGCRCFVGRVSLSLVISTAFAG